MEDNTLFIRCLGFSQDPNTSNYIMVMEYATCSLNKYLKKNNNRMTWEDRMKALLDISIGLEHLHDSKLAHRDFHPGNLLFSNEKYLLITDLGLCKSVDQKSSSVNQKSSFNEKVCGVLPYIAPEVIKGKYTKAADIYSFGMVMYFVATGRMPFNDYHSGSCDFIFDICRENNPLRPEVNEQEAPKFYVDLMKRCWNSDPEKRPKIIEIKEKIRLIYRTPKFIETAEEYRRSHLSGKSNMKDESAESDTTCVQTTAESEDLGIQGTESTFIGSIDITK